MDPRGTARNYLVKPAAAAGIVAAGTALWAPGYTIKIPGTQTEMNPILLAAGATFVAVEVASLINQYLFPHIPVINALEAPAHTALNVGAIIAVTKTAEEFAAPGVTQDIPL